MKRGGNVGLFPFPRVGRSDPELSNWEPATAALLNSLEDYNGRYWGIGVHLIPQLTLFVVCVSSARSLPCRNQTTRTNALSACWPIGIQARLVSVLILESR